MVGPPPLPETVEGTFLFIVTVIPNPGKADEVARYVAMAREHAESDKEPDTLTFRPMRGWGTESDQIRIFVEIKSKDALDHHIKLNPGFLAFKEAGIGTDKVEYFQEIGG